MINIILGWIWLCELCALLYTRMQELSFQKGDLVLLVSDLLMVRKHQHISESIP